MSLRETLPIASSVTLRRYLRTIAADYRADLVVMVLLHATAAGAGLVVPWLVGELVQSATGSGSLSSIDRITAIVAGCLLAQTVLTRYARLRSATFGETVLARLREDFVDEALRLPIGAVEQAGSGDLLTRTSRDVDTLGWSVRYALPETLVALVTAVCTVVAALLVGGWTGLALVAAVPILALATRWYLARAKDGYLREHASYSRINATLAETVDGARTVEALDLHDDRRARLDADIAESYAAESYTRRLRTVFFPAVEIGYLVPVVGTLLIGSWLYAEGTISLAELTAALLYVRFLIDPVDRLLNWMDTLQIGVTSLARLLGVGEVPDDRSAAHGRPGEEPRVRLEAVRFEYRAGREVLHGVDLDVAPGERLAVVGPSGAGKSTIGRLVAGIAGPTAGSVTVGGVPTTEVALAELRRHVVLLTQEHHVFVGTLRDNLLLALDGADVDDDRLRGALGAVEALDWVDRLPHRLDTLVGSGGHELTDAQAQQVALARVVLADPHTLVLDEATSLIDPRAARHLERSLGAVLDGRTVIAIAHRLSTAHDADRVAVVEDGRISELGSHHDLVERDGSYAALWRSWHG